MQQDPVGADLRTQPALVFMRPRLDPAITKPQPQQHLHWYTAVDALDDAHERRGPLVPRHKIDHPHSPIGRFVHGFQDRRLAPIAAPRRHPRPGGRQSPTPVPRVTEQRREASVAVESRPAEELHRTGTRDQCACPTIAHRRVLRDASRQSSPAARWRPDGGSPASREDGVARDKEGCMAARDPLLSGRRRNVATEALVQFKLT